MFCAAGLNTCEESTFYVKLLCSNNHKLRDFVAVDLQVIVVAFAQALYQSLHILHGFGQAGGWRVEVYKHKVVILVYFIFPSLSGWSCQTCAHGFHHRYWVPSEESGDHPDLYRLQGARQTPSGFVHLVYYSVHPDYQWLVKWESTTHYIMFQVFNCRLED